MNLRNIIILIIIIIFLVNYFNDGYSKMEKMDGKKKILINNVKDDENDIYINPYLLNNEIVPNVIKKYTDNKINIITNYQGSGKNIYDSAINSSNNNTNKNNLIHFINFLI